jgi:hypothetical protein
MRKNPGEKLIHRDFCEFLYTAIGLSDGVPNVVMTIHTFDDYMEKFYPYLQ